MNPDIKHYGMNIKKPFHISIKRFIYKKISSEILLVLREKILKNKRSDRKLKDRDISQKIGIFLYTKYKLKNF